MLLFLALATRHFVTRNSYLLNMSLTILIIPEENTILFSQRNEKTRSESNAARSILVWSKA